MSLLNYSTRIASETTVSEIQKILAQHGATAILSEYDAGGNLVVLSFKLPIRDRIVAFRLPCDWQPVLHVLEEDRKVPRRLCNQEQALRVAWRILLVWVKAQMAIIDTQMVELAEVFLPYAITKDGNTLYEVAQYEPLLLPPA